MRVPRIAGSWCPNSAEEILRIVEDGRPVGSTLVRPAALIVPHAGYAYSGGVAARAFADDVKTRLGMLDGEMFEVLAENDNRKWSEALHRTGATICGASCLHLLLAALPESARFERLEYATSGDRTGDWTHVVGYTSGAVFADWAAP